MVQVIRATGLLTDPLQVAEQALRSSGLPLHDIRTDPVAGTVTARTGASLLSWGETVQVAVEVGDTVTVFQVRSRTPQPVTWGKNDSNEHAIAAALRPLV